MVRTLTHTHTQTQVRPIFEGSNKNVGLERGQCFLHSCTNWKLLTNFHHHVTLTFSLETAVMKLSRVKHVLQRGF